MVWNKQYICKEEKNPERDLKLITSPAEGWIWEFITGQMELNINYI